MHIRIRTEDSVSKNDKDLLSVITVTILTSQYNKWDQKTCALSQKPLY